MKFALRMTMRELRASWKRLVFFVLSLSLGVGSIVLLRSTIQSVNAYTTRESRAMNGGDILLRTSRGWTDRARAEIERITSSPAIRQHTSVIEVPTMLKPEGNEDAAKMVELKAVEPAYPLYGELKLVGGAPYSYELLRDGGALLSPSVAAQLDLRVGDAIFLGDKRFEIRGLVAQEPDAGLGAFSVGSRVFIGADDLRASSLLGFRGRTRETMLLAIDEQAYPALLADLKTAVKSDLATVRGFRESETATNAQLASTSDFLSLVGLAILVLGGVGIWSVTRVYIAERWRTIAILKCLGSSNRSAVFAYTLQMIVIGLMGGLAGIALAWVALAIVARTLQGGALATIPIGVSPSAAAQGLALGVLVALLFSLTSLLGIRDVRPNLVLRSADPQATARWNLTRVVSFLVVATGTGAVAAWQAGSPRIGAIFLTGLAITGAVSALSAEALIRFVRVFRLTPSFLLRHATLGIRRPGNQTRAVILTIGLGVFFLVGIFGVQRSLLHTLDLRRTADAPDTYVVDVQPDQVGALSSIVKDATGTAPILVSTVRARIAELDGRPLELDGVADQRKRGALAREYTLTSRPNLDDKETVVNGAWWDGSDGSEPEVSIEESMVRDFGLGVGKTITLDVQGRRITARISSVRHVDWQNARLGFMMVFRPGSFGQLNQVSIGAFQGPEDAMARGRLARSIADALPNVSLIDARDIIQNVDRIVRSISTALTVVGVIVLVAGVLILVGAVAMSRYVREHETAVMKTLGARSRMILGLLVTEHAMLGTIAGVVGTGLGALLSWYVSSRVFELEWRFDTPVAIAGVAGTIILVTAVGMMSTADLLVLKPLGVLRRGE